MSQSPAPTPANDGASGAGAAAFTDGAPSDAVPSPDAGAAPEALETPEKAGPGSGHVVSTVSAVVVGVLVGLAGTLVHRWSHQGFPEGLVGAMALVVIGGVFARAAADRVGLLLYLLATFMTVVTLTYLAPGDVLVTDDAVSKAWLLGVPLAALVAAVTPRRWYADSPVRSRASRTEQ